MARILDRHRCPVCRHPAPADAVGCRTVFRNGGLRMGRMCRECEAESRAQYGPRVGDRVAITPEALDERLVTYPHRIGRAVNWMPVIEVHGWEVVVVALFYGVGTDNSVLERHLFGPHQYRLVRRAAA